MAWPTQTVPSTVETVLHFHPLIGGLWQGLQHPPTPTHTSHSRPRVLSKKSGSFQSLFNVEDKHFIREDKLPELGAEDLLFFYFHLKFFLQTLIPFFLGTVTLEVQTLNHYCNLELGRPLVAIPETTYLRVGVTAVAFQLTKKAGIFTLIWLTSRALVIGSP